MATINGKPSVFQAVEPPAGGKLLQAGADRGRHWQAVAESLVDEVKAQIDREFPRNRNPVTKPTEPKSVGVEKTYAYLDVNGKREPIMIHRGDDLQLLANEQQRVVIGVCGKRETFYMPRKPEKVLIFTENQSHIRTLINSVDTPSERFDQRCEDYADKYQVKVVAVFPDGSWREYPSVSEKDRAYLRKYNPTMSECRRCGSITCAGVSSTGIRCGEVS